MPHATKALEVSDTIEEDGIKTRLLNKVAVSYFLHGKYDEAETIDRQP
jgi:hypothetical protein